MYDDIENHVIKKDKTTNTSNKFDLNDLKIPQFYKNCDILSISTSKKFIYLLTNRSEILCIESKTLKPIEQSFTIPSPSSESKTIFKEKLNKIWTERSGNHSIIRYKDGIYYFNNQALSAKELKKFRDIEICAVAFDDRNNDTKNTGNFLVADYYNNIYECNISVESIDSEGVIHLKQNIEKIINLNFEYDEDEEEENKENKDKENKDKDNKDNKDNKEIKEKKDKKENSNFVKRINDRIYDIKFIKSSKSNIDKEEEKSYFILCVTKNKYYQFYGPASTNFKEFFERYELNPALFNSSCKFFPENSNNLRVKGLFKTTYLDMIYKTIEKKIDDNICNIDVFDRFGWKTSVGYCFGEFDYDNDILPKEQKNFTFLPYEKIIDTNQFLGKQLIDIANSRFFVFLLFTDCISIINKITSNIIQKIELRINYEKIIYCEFTENNGIILLISKDGFGKISLKNENDDIWKDYVEVGDYKNALKVCDSEEKKLRINRIDAEDDFYNKKNKRIEAAKKFAKSDERFENVCLKYLMINDLSGLNEYLAFYDKTNINKDDKGDKENKKKEPLTTAQEFQLLFIGSLKIELFVDRKKEFKEDEEPHIDDMEDMDVFRQLVRDYKDYLSKEIVYSIIQRSGKTNKFIEFASIMGDYEKVISCYIDLGMFDLAAEQLTWFASFSDDIETLNILSQIFLDNCHIFLKKCPKESVSLLQQRFKDIELELIIKAIMSTSDKNYNEDLIKNNSKLTKEEIENIEKEKKEREKKDRENNQAILGYLKSLIEKPRIKEENNIHNLYIYYLSKNKINQEAIINYLKGPFNADNEHNMYHKRKEVLFNLDYAKKLFKDNPSAYALVLALSGKQIEGVRIALIENSNECHNIAKFIATTCKKIELKKQLWIEIFSYYNQKGFKQALDIMTESKILKIEDVLPYITDTIKIEDFKSEISNCINDYEKNIKKLKEDINEFSKTAENIKGDIYNVKKKSTDIEYNNCKCEICQEFISNKDIFLFPCGHMFDIKCMKKCLLDYETTGLDRIHDKNVKIDELFYKLGYSKERSFRKPKEKNEIENKKKESKPEKGLFKKNKKQEIKEVKEEDGQRAKDPIEIYFLKKKLIEILSEQCILCGDFIVDSIQCPLKKKTKFEPDINGLKLIIPNELDFSYS